MDKRKVVTRILIVIALAGLPCWVCWQMGAVMGWLRYIYGGNEHEKNRISR